MNIVLLLLVLLFAPPDPHLSALWDTNTSATVQFTLVSRACLSVEHQTGARVGIACYDRVGTIRVLLGHTGPLSGDLRPTSGDVYVLSDTGGELARAPLVGRRVYLAAWRN